MTLEWLEFTILQYVTHLSQDLYLNLKWVWGRVLGFSLLTKLN